MENKDDLIGRGAALDIVAKDSGMAGTHDQIESLPGQMTAEEAWEIARKIVCDLSEDALLRIFNTTDRELVLLTESPGEAKAKIEAWENRLKVGDVVEYALNKKKGVVVADCNPNSGLCHILFQGGISFGCLVEHLRKTGKTIDIQSVLEQLGEQAMGKKPHKASVFTRYFLPGKKKVIAYSTLAVSDFIDVMAQEYKTIKDIYEAINYDQEAKKILKLYIDAGYGDSVAREFFKE